MFKTFIYNIEEVAGKIVDPFKKDGTFLQVNLSVILYKEEFDNSARNMGHGLFYRWLGYNVVEMKVIKQYRMC